MERTRLQLELQHEDAVHVIKTALAGTATTKFTDMMEAVFGIDEDEEEIPEITPTAPEAEEDLPESMFTTLEEAEPEGPSTSTGKCVANGGKKPPAKKQKRKATAPSKSGPFPIQDATVVYPTKSDKERGYLHTRVEDKYIKDRNSGPFAKTSIYRMSLLLPLCNGIISATFMASGNLP